LRLFHIRGGFYGGDAKPGYSLRGLDDRGGGNYRAYPVQLRFQGFQPFFRPLGGIADAAQGLLRFPRNCVKAARGGGNNYLYFIFRHEPATFAFFFARGYNGKKDEYGVKAMNLLSNVCLYVVAFPLFLSVVLLIFCPFYAFLGLIAFRDSWILKIFPYVFMFSLVFILLYPPKKV
jgi:hypothetical protein